MITLKTLDNHIPQLTDRRSLWSLL